MAVVVYTQAADITSQNPSGQNNSLYFPEWGIDITNGTDFSAVGQQTVVKISRRFAARFLSVLKCGVTDEIHFDAQSPAELRFQASCTNAGSTTANTINKIRVTGMGRAIDAGGGTVTTAEMTSGELTIAGGTVLTNAIIFGGRSFFEYNATGMSSALFSGCNAVVRRGMAANQVCYVNNRANVLFARATTAASSGLSITGGSGLLRIDNATVNWQGGVIDAIELASANSNFVWQDMYESVTLPLVRGDANAIFRTGLREGAVNISRFGATITVSSIVPYGMKVSEVGGGDIPA